jgi:5-(carboxyamino)imidazole ribonucleotide synthase
MGRMTCLAARQMGYRVVVLDPRPGSPAGQVADRQIVGRLDDQKVAATLADCCDAVTLEGEHLVAATAAFLETRLPVRPGARVLQVTQNRLVEKSFLRGAGIPVAPFAAVHDRHDLVAAHLQIGFPAVLKTATLGHDGKGQAVVRSAEEGTHAYADLGGTCMLERWQDVEREVSVIVARDAGGRMVAYAPAENALAGGVLDYSTVPARLSPDVARAARTMAVRAAEALELVGVLAVELFLGADGTLLVNEVAPRPHDSGHWSIEACLTSQFEQQARLALGASVGPSELLRPAATAMLMGDLWSAAEPVWERLLAMPDVKLHLYGEAEARPGRKMGHLTVLAASPEAARERVLAARAALSPA